MAKNSKRQTLHMLDGGGCMLLNNIDKKKKQICFDIFLSLAFGELILSQIDFTADDIDKFLEVINGKDGEYEHEDFRMKHASKPQDPPILVLYGGDNEADFEIVLRPTEDDVEAITEVFKEVRKEIA